MRKSFLFSLILLPILAQAQFKFTDKNDFPSWAEEAISTVQEREIMKGFGDGSFRPNQNITRAEIATLLIRSNKHDFDKKFQGEIPFSDVPSDAWFKDSVGIAVREGWVKGRPDGKFYPADNLTRAEFSALVARSFNLKAGKISEMPFQDIARAQWYAESVSALYESKLLRNHKNRYFRPSQFVTRADAAWTFSQIARRPAINGSVKPKEVGESTYNSRRVAIKPRNFNANKQGYEIEKKAFYVSVDTVSEVIKFQKKSDWIHIGNIRVENKFDSTAQLNHVDFQLKFDRSNMGPAKSFEAQISSKGVIKEALFSKNGEAFFPDVNILLSAGSDAVFSLKIKPRTDQSFYPRLATGLVYVDSVGGEVFKAFVKRNSNRSKSTRNALVQYHSRNLTKFEFNPLEIPSTTE